MKAREDRRHLPIEAEHHATMNATAEALGEIFKGYGFALLVFPLGENDGRMNYVCNCERGDMLTAMREFIAHNEGRAHHAPTVTQ